MNQNPEASAARPGDIVELDITNVAHGGVSVARLEGRVVFVADAIPGEKVRARLTETSKKSFWRADTVEVIDASPYRRPHIWASAALERDPAERAGGAEFGHIALEHQRELKRQVLADSLTRFGSLPSGFADGVVVESAGDDDARNGLGWRTRVSLHIDADGRVGPYAARSHRVIPVTDLPLASEQIAVLAPLRRRIDGEAVDIVAPSGSEARMIVHPRQRDARNTIVERVGSREFVLDDGGFWQVHRDAARILSDAVVEAIDDALFDPRAANLDLYGGVGLFAAALGEKFGSSTRMTSVESSERATDHAAENLADWVGARAVTARVDRYLGSLANEGAGRLVLEGATVVLDPPRSGAGRDVVDRLVSLEPAQIVYVACDPVALSRDLGLFAAQGYSVDSLRAFDLFPHTHHVEAIARLTKK